MRFDKETAAVLKEWQFLWCKQRRVCEAAGSEQFGEPSRLESSNGEVFVFGANDAAVKVLRVRASKIRQPELRRTTGTAGIGNRGAIQALNASWRKPCMT